VKLSDRSTQTFTRSGVYQKGNCVSIRSMGGWDTVMFRETEQDLVCLGRGKGGTLTLFFRNEWYDDGAQAVSSFKVFLNKVMLTEESVNIQPARYYAINIPVPHDITPIENYEVKLVANSVEELNSTYSSSVLCQHIRIQ